jgi:hypothetical protein
VTARRDGDSFGPYAFTLATAETEAAAARLGLRTALGGGLIGRHLAPLAVFVLVLLFAAILALTGFISRRAGEATILLAAAAFMVQRLATHWRIRGARRRSQEAIAELSRGGALTATIGEDGIALTGSGHPVRIDYAECAEAEDAGGLIYLWPRGGLPPIVLPTRALADGEAAPLIARIRQRIAETRRETGSS